MVWLLWARFVVLALLAGLVGSFVWACLAEAHSEGGCEGGLQLSDRPEH